MKKNILLLAVIGLITLQGCTVHDSVPVYTNNVNTTTSSEVFELQNVNFGYNQIDGYTIYQKLIPNINSSDVVLMYRLAGTIDSSTPIWQPIPRTLFLPQGELDYDFDFSKEDFTIYAGGNYDLSATPMYLNNQTFRIVIVPGYFSKKVGTIDTGNYNEVIKAYNIDESKIIRLNP